ncbi:MAG TPA: glycosyltransferase family 4 protein [Tessaracoccus flavescens]|uniref:Glycosyltransferase family 4 protein n=1 Tax=Tessaracoccus flavescens TaxID=399497 RepID=A0A921EQX9_9ACTN|nr:glycosyltransferase family 4 protein [Tessaracoccus flavescens]
MLVTQHFAPEHNPPSFRWGWLTRSFAEQGVTVDVLTAAQSRVNDAPWPTSVRVHRLRNILRGRGLATRLLNELMLAFKFVATALRLPRPDVVIVTAPPLGAMLYAKPLAALLRRPLVLEVRDAWPELLDEWPTWSDYGNGPTPRRLRDAAAQATIRVIRPWMLAARKSASLVVCTSRTYGKHLEQEGVRKVLVIPNRSATSVRFPPREFDGTLRILYLGKVGRAQLLATAVRAAAMVKEQGGSIVLRLVGGGAHLVALQRLADQLDAPVEFLTRVPLDQVPEHYEWADSLLVILRDWEAMSMTVPSKLLEMIGTDKHISASVTGEPARLVRESGAGDVVEPQSAEALAELWLRLIREPEHLRRNPADEWLGKLRDQQTLGALYVEALREAAARR